MPLNDLEMDVTRNVNVFLSYVKRIIYITLVAMFLSRIYFSCVKLKASDVSFSQKVLQEDPQMYPSFMICATYSPFFGPDAIASMSSNLTEIYNAHKVLIEHIILLRHQYEDENG